ncbi:MAG: DNA-protecting protein DprA [Candidatus Chisholmbacteria bacterium]|nr:DNA-protecting protein DprA [Candidatus Chisholmbacteria bacterium]
MIRQLSKEDKDFPVGLRQVEPQVKQLFYQGEWERGWFKKCVAVVGARRMTDYGVRVVAKLIPVLVEAGVKIVSGFMYGVDQAAHKETLASGGKTIAVLGWGIDWQMADDDLVLAHEIIDKGGLVMSEWENQAPALWTFPQRNRIVAGLAEAVVVIEAGEKSGSLITVEWAKKLGKKVLAVPGPITSKMSIGTNQLIKSSEAVMVRSGEEILEELGWGKNSIKYRVVSIKYKKYNKASQILKLLENEALTVDQIVRQVGKGAAEVGAELSLLVLKGEVEEKEGKYYLV